MRALRMPLVIRSKTSACGFGLNLAVFEEETHAHPRHHLRAVIRISLPALNFTFRHTCQRAIDGGRGLDQLWQEPNELSARSGWPPRYVGGIHQIQC